MKTKNIKIGAIITYIQLFANIIISLGFTRIVIETLGAGEHGLYSTVSSTISFLSLLSLGIGSSYIRFYSRYTVNNEKNKLYSLNGLYLSLYVVIGLIALICGIILSFNLDLIFKDGLSSSEYIIAKKLSLIVTLDLAISFPASIFNSIIRANENFIWIKTINMLQSVLSPLLTIPVLLLGYGSVGMVVVTTAIDMLAYLFNILFCLFKLKAKFVFNSFEKGLFKSIFSFSIFIALNSIIAQINASLDKLLLARYVNTTSVSIYTIGCSLYVYYSSFSSAISSLFTPHIHKTVNINNENSVILRKELTSIFIKLGRIQFLIQMLMLSGIVFFGQAFIKLWVGEMYDNSYYVALILCVAYTIPLCQNIGTEIQQAQNKHQIRTVVFTIMTLINIALTIILCKKYGEIGAVIGTAISAVAVEVIFMNVYYHKKLNINVIEYWKEFASNCKGLIIPIITGVIILKFTDIDNYYALLFFIVIYSVIYCLSMWLFVMNEFEKDLFAGIIFKLFRRKHNE